MKRNERGFTLMELMVVIVIVAILAAVAVPLYINYVKDAQRTEAKGAIGAIITGEQTYYQRYGAYTTDTSAVHVDLSDVGHNWTFAITSGEPTDGYAVTATGIVGKPSEGLEVTYTQSRSNPPKDPWEEH